MSGLTILLLLSLFLLQIKDNNSIKQETFTKDNGTLKAVMEDIRNLKELNHTSIYNVKVAKGSRAKLSFKSFEVFGQMPNCSEDSLEILVGCRNKSIGKFCGASKPLDIYSKDECITLIFYTASFCGKGFEAEYFSFNKSVSISNERTCRNLVQNTTGNFFSPLWPNHYLANLTCTWKLNLPKHFVARVYFMDLRIEDNLSCNKASTVDDYISITASNGKTNETIEQRLCTAYADKTMYVDIHNRSTVYVTFVTDKDTVTSVETGFAAGFISFQPGLKHSFKEFVCSRSSSSFSYGFIVVSVVLAVLLFN